MKRRGNPSGLATLVLPTRLSPAIALAEFGVGAQGSLPTDPTSLALFAVGLDLQETCWCDAPWRKPRASWSARGCRFCLVATCPASFCLCLCRLGTLSRGDRWTDETRRKL